MTARRDQVVIYRPDIDPGRARFHVWRALGHCLAEIPNGSIIITDLNTPPRVGDLASFGLTHELGKPDSISFAKRISYRHIRGRDELVYEADGGLVLPLTADLPILGAVYAVYSPANAGRRTTRSIEIDAIHQRTIRETAHIARRLNASTARQARSRLA